MDDVEDERRQPGDVADAVGVVWPWIVEQLGDAMETCDEGDAFNPALVSRRRELVVLAGADPKAAVLGAWAELERSLINAGERWGVRKRARAQRLLEEIPARAGLNASVRARINSLRRLRNAAAHGKDEIGRAQAGDYVVLALQLSAHVDFVTDPANDSHFVAGWRDWLATRD